MIKLYSFFLVFLFNCSFAVGQSKNITEINGNSFSIRVKSDNLKFKDEAKGNFTVRDYFEFTDVLNPGTYKLPFKDIIIAIPSNSTPRISAASFDTKELKGFLPKLNPEVSLNKDSTFSYIDVELKDRITSEAVKDIFEVKGYFWLRDFYCVKIRINSHIFKESSNSLIEHETIKLKFDFNAGNFAVPIAIGIITEKSLFDNSLSKIIYNYDIAEQFRSSPKIIVNDSTDNWINYNAEYIKLYIAEDGIFRLNKNDLEQIGINTAAINPQTFRLLESGNEIPIYLEGEGDGIFNDNDYLEFFGTKNYPDISARVINADGTPYNEYLNRLTDTSIYFLTWGGTNGKRMPEQNVFQSGLTDTVDFYTHFTHYEENLMYQPLSTNTSRNQDPDWLETNSWYRSYISSVRDNIFNKIDQEIVPNKSAEFFYKLVSSASSVSLNSHQVTLKVNGIVIDSQTANMNDRILLEGILNTNSLIGNNSILSVVNHPNGTLPNQLVHDWFEVEYPRYLKLVNDSLLFEIKYDLPALPRIIKIEDVFTNNLEIYKIKPELKRITNYTVSSANLYFTDTIETGDAYVVIDPLKIKKPAFFEKKQFINLRDPSRIADYIAISHPSLQAAAFDYTNFIAGQYNINTALVFIEDIFDEFSYGYPDPVGIKIFLKAALQYWQNPKPAYVNILGSASYDYKNIKIENVNKNLVPSYGEPVSDTWFTMFDSTNSLIHQLMIGRIPANYPEELQSYLVKHQNYLTQTYDLWNKRAIFFSGGDANTPGQINSLKNVNDFIINNYASVRPVSEDYNHFYKTINPTTDFGPYSNSYVLNSIKEGGIYISYIGHSGTTTWDNSISDPDQLLNVYNKSSLITDFGCSTNKFAEPNILAFGNLFVLNGQAIGYIGNSSLGFLPTSITVPKYFYESILKDSIYNISKAHFDAKIKMFNNLGNTGVYRIFALTNVLLGDPIIELAIPPKPNITISNPDIYLTDPLPNEQMDSLGIVIKYFNLGMAPADSFSINIINNYEGNQIYADTIRKIIPEFNDSLLVYIPIKGKPGEHLVNVILDIPNEIDEINEADNEADFAFNVTSLSIKPIIYSKFYSALSSPLTVLNQSGFIQLNNEKIITEVDTTEQFTSSSFIETPLDTFISQINLNSLENGKRYWLRSRLDYGQIYWSDNISFIKSDIKSNFHLSDQYSFSGQNMQNLLNGDDGLKLLIDTIIIKVESGGGDVNKYGSIMVNGINVLPNTFLWGMGIAVFDSITLKIDTAQTFWYGDNPAMADSLTSLINSIPQGKIVAMNVIDDGRSSLSASLKNAIKTLGSTKVDSITFRGPWVLIGRKGAAPGSIIEIVKNRNYPAILSVDTAFIRFRKNGTLTASNIGPSSSWNKLNVSQSIPFDSDIKYKAIGENINGSADTLGYLNLVNNSADLSFIDASVYPFIQIISEFEAANDGISPSLSSLEIDYLGTPELGTNFQTAQINKDSIKHDEEIELDFSIYNAGQAEADSVKLLVELLKPDNSKRILIDTLIAQIDSMGKEHFNFNFKPWQSDQDGNMAFVINIDPDGKFIELYRDNNIFNIPFYIKKDTTIVSVSPATLSVTFDGAEIIDGDYISPKPDIKMVLNYPSWFPVTDTASVEFYLNQERVYYQQLNINYDTANRRIIYTYNPTLPDGEYILRVFGDNIHGNLEDAPGYEKYFFVSNYAQISDIYNYPNPFSSNTYFTFRLTQIPDEVKIKIYTVAGRLIKEFNITTDLQMNFNTISWNGRDEDGDLIGNGVYFYKVIMRQGEKTQDVTQKLAVIR